MKTMDELFKEIMTDKALKAEAVKAYEADKMDEFAANHGVTMTKEEIKAFLDAEYKKLKSSELSDDDLDSVAGGTAVPYGQSGTTSWARDFKGQLVPEFNEDGTLSKDYLAALEQEKKTIQKSPIYWPFW